MSNKYSALLLYSLLFIGFLIIDNLENNLYANFVFKDEQLFYYSKTISLIKLTNEGRRPKYKDLNKSRFQRVGRRGSRRRPGYSGNSGGGWNPQSYVDYSGDSAATKFNKKCALCGKTACAKYSYKCNRKSRRKR